VFQVVGRKRYSFNTTGFLWYLLKDLCLNKRGCGEGVRKKKKEKMG